MRYGKHLEGVVKIILLTAQNRQVNKTSKGDEKDENDFL